MYALHNELVCVCCGETLVGTLESTDKHGYTGYKCAVCGCVNFTNEVEFANYVFQEVNG